MDKEILFSLVIHNPATPPVLLWCKELKTTSAWERQSSPILSKPTALENHLWAEMMTKNRNVHFQLLILWRNNDKKLVGVNMLTRKKNPQAKPRKWNCFYCFKLGKVSSVTAHRMKRCLVCGWLRVATKRLGKTFLVTNMLRFQPAITLDLSDSSWKSSHDKCYRSSVDH